MPAHSSKPNILLNEQGPYVNSESLLSRGVELLNHDLPDLPSNLTVDDVSEISKTLTTPPPTPIHPPTSVTTERSQETMCTHDMFDRSSSSPELSKSLFKYHFPPLLLNQNTRPLIASKLLERY